MDHVKAFQAVNAELRKHGRPPLVMGDLQQRAAFASLQQYAHTTQRPLELAIADMVRFQMQSDELERLKA